VREGKAVAHLFDRSCVRSGDGAPAYWRDAGTVDAFFDANLDLTEVVPELDLYDPDWPIWTYSEMTAPAKFVHDSPGRRGFATSSVVAGGSVISGAAVNRSVLFNHVRVRSYSEVDQAVILPEVVVSENARLRKVIVDRRVIIPDGLVVGENPEEDARRFRRTDSGVCLITQSMVDRLSG
jgi:glucose-1-phosphate adenylyltransferase